MFEYNKEKGAVILSIDHNAGLASEEEMRSDISFIIVHRLVDELEQAVVPDGSGSKKSKRAST